MLHFLEILAIIVAIGALFAAIKAAFAPIGWVLRSASRALSKKNKDEK